MIALNSKARTIVFAALICMAFHPIACRAEVPKVVVTIKPVHSLAAAVMAGIGMPTLLVEGLASPHTFTLKPSAARSISEAQLFVRVSEHIEPFTRKIVEALPASVRLVTLIDVPGVKLLKLRQGGTFETHTHDQAEPPTAEHAHDDDGAGVDGHVWLDPENAKRMAFRLAEVLAEIDPVDAAAYRANATRLAVRIDRESRDIQQLLQPVKGRSFIAFHDAYHYFEESFGVAAAGSVTVSPDVQPSAKRLAAVRQKIIALGSTCVFAEPAFQPALLASVTEGTPARTGTLDAEGLLLEPGPELYFRLMHGLADSLRACMLPPS